MLLHFFLVLLAFLFLDHLEVELSFLLFHFVDLVEGLVPVNYFAIVFDFFICVILANNLAQICSDTLFKKSWLNEDLNFFLAKILTFGLLDDLCLELFNFAAVKGILEENEGTLTVEVDRIQMIQNLFHLSFR